MRTFTLGGAEFTAPEKIGAGARARITQALVSIARQKYVKAVDTDISLYGELKDPEALMTWCFTEYPYDTVVALLTNVLTPAGSVSVTEAYEAAEDQEVAAVISFFNVAASSKIGGGQNSTGSGAATSETATENP